MSITGPRRPNGQDGDLRNLFACDRIPHPPVRTGDWWSQTGSNRRPHACKARALPTELWPQNESRSGELVGLKPCQESVVGPGRLELPTLRLSGVRSNHLSYGPVRRRSVIPPLRKEQPAWGSRSRSAPNGTELAGKRNEDGGDPQFFDASIRLVKTLEKASLERR